MNPRPDGRRAAIEERTGREYSNKKGSSIFPAILGGARQEDGERQAYFPAISGARVKADKGEGGRARQAYFPAIFGTTRRMTREDADGGALKGKGGVG